MAVLQSSANINNQAFVIITSFVKKQRQDNAMNRNLCDVEEKKMVNFK